MCICTTKYGVKKLVALMDELERSSQLFSSTHYTKMVQTTQPMVYIVKPFSNSMSLVATAILVTGYTRGWRQCSITAVSKIQKKVQVTNNHLVGLDVFREILDAILIAMRNPDEIQMCSVESYGMDTLYIRTQDITLRSQKKHFKRMCYSASPVIRHSHVWMSTMAQMYDIVYYDLFSHSYLICIVFIMVVWMILFHLYKCNNVLV